MAKKISDCNIAKNKTILVLLIFTVSIMALTPVSSAVSSNNTTTYTISYLDTSVGGNVLANPEISQNIPKTDLSTKIFNMERNGSVVIKFGNGNGPKLLISTGIHGNEEEANIAVMKYLEYIKNKQFNGTLYVVPFDIPRDTALNSRYYKGTDPNRCSNIQGTPGWKIVQFAKNHGIKYILDVHSGSQVEPAGCIYINSGSTITKEDKNWSNYIKSRTGAYVTTNGLSTAGMLRCYASSLGINTITMEVERDTVPTTTAASTEYKMIMAAVKYLGFPSYTSSNPYVFSTNPPKNATKVSLTSEINITFSENILKGSSFAGIYIKNLNTGKIDKISSKFISGNILTLKESSSRLSKNSYQIWIPKGAIKDVDGNILCSDYISTFKTV
ncbi:MAG TPA: Ig-like domain-containing protein [Methanobacterium sp.]|nr:Ig-like domain-containing protein [Methanobacterium sp.]